MGEAYIHIYISAFTESFSKVSSLYLPCGVVCRVRTERVIELLIIISIHYAYNIYGLLQRRNDQEMILYMNILFIGAISGAWVIMQI